MNRRSRALWTSVIVAGLAAPGIARAGALAEIGSGLPEANVAGNVQGDVGVKGNVRVNGNAGVKGNARVKTDLRLTADSPGRRRAGRPAASAKATGTVQAGRSSARSRLAGHAAAGLPRTRGAERMRARGEVRGRVASSGAAAASGRVTPDHHRGRTRHHSRAARQPHLRTASQTTALRPSGPPTNESANDPDPLRAVGREVGNPIQLHLAAWLIALTGAAAIAVSRLGRRRSRL
jgi:hypothetical protein